MVKWNYLNSSVECLLFEDVALVLLYWSKGDRSVSFIAFYFYTIFGHKGRGKASLSVCRLIKVSWNTSEVFPYTRNLREASSSPDKRFGIIVGCCCALLFGLMPWSRFLEFLMYWLKLNVDRLLRPDGEVRRRRLHHGPHHGGNAVVGRRKRWFWAEQLFCQVK